MKYIAPTEALSTTLTPTKLSLPLLSCFFYQHSSTSSMSNPRSTLLLVKFLVIVSTFLNVQLSAPLLDLLLKSCLPSPALLAHLLAMWMSLPVLLSSLSLTIHLRPP